MNYYKLISGTNFIGVATQHDFREFQHKHSIILACAEDRAQYIQCADAFYRSNWMSPVTTDEISYESVDVIKIDKEEYDILLKAIGDGEEITVEPEQPEPVEPPPVDENEEVTVEYVKNRKIAEMSAACNSVITNGFDVKLSDENTYHFSLRLKTSLTSLPFRQWFQAAKLRFHITRTENSANSILPRTSPQSFLRQRHLRHSKSRIITHFGRMSNL